MILDSIENLHKYAALNPYIDKIVAFINDNDIFDMPTGRVEIDGINCFANFDTAHGKTKNQALLESHNGMVDIQLVCHDSELIGWSQRSSLPNAEYNAEKDITFYGRAKPEQYINLKHGQFLMFFPGDAHAPCISERESYRKIIFKLRNV